MAPRIFAPTFVLLLSVSSGCSGEMEYADWEHGGGWGGQLEAAGGQVRAAGGHTSASGGSDSPAAGVGGGTGGESYGTGGAESGTGAVDNETGGLDNEVERECQGEDSEARACGLNDRGQSERVCTHGVWGAWGLCIDPDECEDGEWRHIACEQPGPKTLQPQECLIGVWHATEGCILPCEEGLTYDSLLDACMDSVSCVPRDAPFGGGTGTPEDPYTICSVAHLQALTTSPDSHFVLAQSLDLADAVDFTPLCTAEAPFSGTFDGRGRILAHLTIQRAGSDDVGLFSWIDGGEVVDLRLQDVEVRGKNFVGALAAHAQNAAHVETVTVEGGRVEGSNFVGGLLGQIQQSTASDSAASVDVLGSFEKRPSGYWGVGGLIGNSDSGTVVAGSARGTVTGMEQVGGLVGTAHASTISDSLATGAVMGEDQFGGLVGLLSRSTINDSSATGLVTGLGDGGALAGGLVGDVWTSTVSDSFATGDVRDSVSSGGLAGLVSNGSTVLRCSATGSVSGADMLGGLIGQFIASTVMDSSASGNVTAPEGVDGYREWVGGLVGYSRWGTLLDSWASGTVSGYEGIGGLLGQADETTLVSGCSGLGEVSGALCVGGLVGLVLDSDVEQSHATGNVFGRDSVGGLLGATGSADITQSYALGNISGDRSVGGLVGSTYQVNISQSYALGNVTGSLEVGALVGYAYLYTSPHVYSSFAREQGTLALVGHVQTEGPPTEPSVDSALLPAAAFGDQTVFSGVGWDFERTWTMSTAQSRPLLLWQVQDESL